MPHVLIIHEVEAYPAWKTIFDQAAGIRKTAGEIRRQPYRALFRMVVPGQRSSFFRITGAGRDQKERRSQSARLSLPARNRARFTLNTHRHVNAPIMRQQPGGKSHAVCQSE